MKQFTDEQLFRWASRQRINYRDGKLTETQIKKLESIPGWSWDESQEDNSAEQGWEMIKAHVGKRCKDLHSDHNVEIVIGADKSVKLRMWSNDDDHIRNEDELLCHRFIRKGNNDPDNLWRSFGTGLDGNPVTDKRGNPIVIDTDWEAWLDGPCHDYYWDAVHKHREISSTSL